MPRVRACLLYTSKPCDYAYALKITGLDLSKAVVPAAGVPAAGGATVTKQPDTVDVDESAAPSTAPAGNGTCLLYTSRCV